jgi:hypothetical protein
LRTKARECSTRRGMGRGRRRRAAATNLWREAVPPSNPWKCTAWPDIGSPLMSRTGFLKRRMDRQTLACLSVPAKVKNRGGAHGMVRGARSGVQAQNSAMYSCLIAIFSRFLNQSATNNLYQSCRSADPLPLLQRQYRLLINGFCIKCSGTLQNTRLW